PFHEEPVTPAYAAMRDLLTSDPTLEPAAVSVSLRERGIAAGQVADAVGSSFLRARREAIFRRIASEPDLPSAEELRAKVLPGVSGASASPVLRAFEEQ